MRVGSLLCAVVLCLPALPASAQSTATVPATVAALLRPILDLQHESVRACRNDGCVETAAAQRDAERWLEIERRLKALIKNQSRAADEALVVLLQFRLGELPFEDVRHHVTVRGKRMLPHIRKYLDKAARIPARDYPSDMRHTPEDADYFLEDAMHYIQEGEVWGEETQPSE